jgi:hypothetical protein
MPKVDWRRIIKEQLEMLASEEEQLAYEAAVPHVDVTKELVEGWFSDSYHPSDVCFRECFSDGELAELARLNDGFERALDALPSSQGSVEIWHGSPVWASVRQQATLALQKLSEAPAP